MGSRPIQPYISICSATILLDEAAAAAAAAVTAAAAATTTTTTTAGVGRSGLWVMYLTRGDGEVSMFRL